MSQILHFIQAGGFVMYPLLLISLIVVGIMAERTLAFVQLGKTSPGLLRQVSALCREGRFEEAVRACDARRGPVAACLATVLRHMDAPTGEIERLVEEKGQDYFIQLESLLPFLDTATTISPLLGLLGTIVGMTGTFNAISNATARGAGTDAILGGVGEALYATATGLTIAIVCFVAYNFFTARLRTITSETEQSVTKLLNVLSEVRRENPEVPHAV